MRVLSVDLGTSNTVAVLSAHGRAPRAVEADGSATMPSAVFAGEDGTLVLGDRVIPVTEALAAVLRRVLDETSRQLGAMTEGEHVEADWKGNGWRGGSGPG